ncbi:non-canonical purine NTP pyrophosphatase, RdgB/HAM1 family [archaeon SCG-AAA382B04]|nr:non-canonical purine NTP pyrophosphatase, RdgB/HAM1 family [archaeon SCG-AAA382B04]
MKITFVTSNIDKVKEINQLVNDDIKITQKNIDYPEIQANIEKVARKGVNWCYEKLTEPLFIEDSGLFIKSLNNFPGPFSSYVFDKIGNKGILDLLANEENRSAYFLSIIAYKDKNHLKLFKGKTEGEIGKERRGKHGFGYDPVFIPKSSNKTFGEMDREEKNNYSHRKKAFKKFSKFLSSKNI